jgi:hypothetical protein
MRSSQPVADRPAPYTPSVKIFFTSLGRSTGDAVQMTIVNDGNVPVEIASDGFSLVPLSALTARDVERELQSLAGRPRVTMTLKAYCRDIDKPVPAAGTVMRLADSRVHAGMRPIQRMLAAARRLVEAGTLKPDVDRETYLDSIRQWALWTMQERFDERAFTTAFAAHTRRNVEASGERWRREYDREVRELAASRWRAVQRVLTEARR